MAEMSIDYSSVDTYCSTKFKREFRSLGEESRSIVRECYDSYIAEHQSEFEPSAKKSRTESNFIRLFRAVKNQRVNVRTVDAHDIWVLPTDENLTWDELRRTELVIRNRWIEICDRMLAAGEGDNRSWELAVLVSRRGRGKSSFMLLMIFRLLQQWPEADMTIAYSRRSRTGVVEQYWITKDDAQLVSNFPPDPTFLLFDGVDNDLELMQGSRLTVSTTTDPDSEIPLFANRYRRTSWHAQVYVLTAMELPELRALMPPTVSDEELQFFFDVFGGSPMVLRQPVEIDSSMHSRRVLFPPMLQCLKMMFGADYDFNLHAYTARGRWARKAIGIIAQEIEGRVKCNWDIFTDYVEDTDYQDREEVRWYATNYMQLMMGALALVDDDVTRGAAAEAKKYHVGEILSHMYLAHSGFVAGKVETKRVGINDQGQIVQLPVGLDGLPVYAIRSLAALQNLPHGAYGLPTLSKFPVDAVLRPNVALIFVPESEYIGSLVRLPQVEQALGIDNNALILIFVTETPEATWRFAFPKEQVGRTMYATPRDVYAAKLLKSIHAKLERPTRSSRLQVK